MNVSYKNGHLKVHVTYLHEGKRYLSFVELIDIDIADGDEILLCTIPKDSTEINVDKIEDINSGGEIPCTSYTLIKELLPEVLIRI